MYKWGLVTAAITDLVVVIIVVKAIYLAKENKYKKAGLTVRERQIKREEWNDKSAPYIIILGLLNILIVLLVGGLLED